MLQLQTLREKREEVIQGLARKNFSEPSLVDQILSGDEERRKLKTLSDHLNAESNNLSKQIGGLMKDGKKSEAEDLKNKTAALKEEIRSVEEKLSNADQNLQDLLVRLPNLPHSSVPPGKSPDENEVIHQEGNIQPISDGLPHWDLASKFNLIDFELGNKITGAGFPVYRGKGARLQRALINYFLDQALKAGYEEIQPPILVNEDSGFGTGQLPDKEGQMYFVSEDKFYLIPTAEVPITNLLRDEILRESDLPLKMMGYTPCFRREAGSYGKEVRGLNRLHQFDKVEIVQIAPPASSYEVLEEMKNHVATLVRSLDLPFRILRLCGGDMSFASALTYDFEVFSAGQNRWLEVSSVSNFETFQANRMKLRYKDKDGKTRLPHTLNGSALALPRIVAALLENHQDKDGIRMPEVLVPYLGFDRIS